MSLHAFLASKALAACSCGPSPRGAGFVKPVGLAGFAANDVVTVDPPEYSVRMYLIAGGGPDQLYEHPSAVWAT